MTISLCENELKYINEKIENEIYSTPEIIYHYTSPSALLSILKNKELWFSNIFFLSDSTEHKYIYLCLKNYIQENADKYNPIFSKQIAEFCDYFIGNNTKYPYHSVLKTYVASFSVQEDELNLWNYYTKNDARIGYNIGFSTKEFLGYSNDGDLITYHGRVIYGKDLLYNIFDKIMPNIYNIYLPLDSIQISILLDDLFYALSKYSVFFKDESFSSEKEYRMVWESNSKVDLREHNGFYIPYQKYSIPVKSIRSFMVSPTQNDNLAKLGIEELLSNYLDAKYIDSIEINKSSIPLRY